MDVEERQPGLRVAPRADPAADGDARCRSARFPFRIDATSTMRSLMDISVDVDYPSSILIYMMKIGMISLGCPKNLVDSEVMLGLAQQAGHELTRDAADADVLVVNTCAFIDSAKQESIDTILEMARAQEDGACQRLVVTGCLAERYRDELKARDPRDRRGARHRRSAGDRRRASAARRRRASRRGAVAADVLSRRTAHRAAQPPTPDRRTPEPADLHLRRRHAAAAGDAAALRLREDRRRLRLQVRVLHHPDAARRLSQPAGRLDRRAKRARWPRAASRNCCSSRRTRRSTASTAASAARWRACCAS